MKMIPLIKIIIAFSFFLISCSDENQNKNNYKKKTDIPLTGQSIDKKVNPSKKVSDFY
jgi:PBP1b-binding outer membrane lipoprotein LpoB